MWQIGSAHGFECLRGFAQVTDDRQGIGLVGVPIRPTGEHLPELGDLSGGHALAMRLQLVPCLGRGEQLINGELAERFAAHVRQALGVGVGVAGVSDVKLVDRLRPWLRVPALACPDDR